jgi:hypothetical protein
MATDIELAELAKSGSSGTESAAPPRAPELGGVYDIPVTVSVVLGKPPRSLGRVGDQAPCREATPPIRQPSPEPPQRVLVRLPAAIAQSPR